MPRASCGKSCSSAGGPQPQIRVVPAQMPQQPGGDAPSEAVSRALQEQEEVARRFAEDNHCRAQLHAALSNTQPPQVPVYTCICIYTE